MKNNRDKNIANAISHLTAIEPAFYNIVAQYGIPEIPTRPQTFQTLLLLILEQQVSVDSAKATFVRLQNMIENLDPEKILATDDTDFRACGVSRQKTLYIKCLATAIIERTLDLELLASQTAIEVRENLIKIKGIGNWTIDVYLMFALQSPDILPLGDVAIATTFKELFDITDRQQMDDYAQRWKPFRSMATFLLWHYYLRKRNRTITY